MLIDGQPVVNNAPRQHDRQRRQVALTAGPHPVEVRYAWQGGPARAGMVLDAAGRRSGRWCRPTVLAPAGPQLAARRGARPRRRRAEPAPAAPPPDRRSPRRGPGRRRRAERAARHRRGRAGQHLYRRQRQPPHRAPGPDGKVAGAWGSATDASAPGKFKLTRRPGRAARRPRGDAGRGQRRRAGVRRPTASRCCTCRTPATERQRHRRRPRWAHLGGRHRRRAGCCASPRRHSRTGAFSAGRRAAHQPLRAAGGRGRGARRHGLRGGPARAHRAPGRGGQGGGEWPVDVGDGARRQPPGRLAGPGGDDRPRPQPAGRARPGQRRACARGRRGHRRPASSACPSASPPAPTASSTSWTATTRGCRCSASLETK